MADTSSDFQCGIWSTDFPDTEGFYFFRDPKRNPDRLFVAYVRQHLVMIRDPLYTRALDTWDVKHLQWYSIAIPMPTVGLVLKS